MVTMSQVEAMRRAKASDVERFQGGQTTRAAAGQAPKTPRLVEAGDGEMESQLGDAVAYAFTAAQTEVGQREKEIERMIEKVREAPDQMRAREIDELRVHMSVLRERDERQQGEHLHNRDVLEGTMREAIASSERHIAKLSELLQEAVKRRDDQERTLDERLAVLDQLNNERRSHIAAMIAAKEAALNVLTADDAKGK